MVIAKFNDILAVGKQVNFITQSTDRGAEGEGLSRDMGFERDSPSPSAPRAIATGNESSSVLGGGSRSGLGALAQVGREDAFAQAK